MSGYVSLLRAYVLTNDTVAILRNYNKLREPARPVDWTYLSELQA